MAKNVAHERRVTIYPEENIFTMVVAESALTNLSISCVVSEALEKYYQTMSRGKLIKIQAKAKVLASYPKKTA